MNILYIYIFLEKYIIIGAETCEKFYIIANVEYNNIYTKNVRYM